MTTYEIELKKNEYILHECSTYIRKDAWTNTLAELYQGGLGEKHKPNWVNKRWSDKKQWLGLMRFSWWWGGCFEDGQEFIVKWDTAEEEEEEEDVWEGCRHKYIECVCPAFCEWCESAELDELGLL